VNFSTSRKAAAFISGEHGLLPKNAPAQLYFSKHGVRTISSYCEQQLTIARTQFGTEVFGFRLAVRIGCRVVVGTLIVVVVVVEASAGMK